MIKRLFVGNLDYKATEDDLRTFFGAYEVTDVRIITDRETHKSRGFGFVELATHAAAKDAAEEMNGRPIHGRNVRVSIAEEKKDRSGSNGGGRPGRRDRY